MMLIWLAIMIAPRGEMYRDDVLMILAEIASWIIWLVFPLAGIEFWSTIILKCVWREGCVVYFSFPFHSNQNLHGFLDLLHILTESFLDDVMHAVKVLQGWSKFSWFNLFCFFLNVFTEGLLSMHSAFQQHPALFTLIQLYAFTPGCHTVNLQCTNT